MKELQNREDIELLVNTFYDKVRNDKMLHHVFDEVAQVNWETHLPKMYDFWENIVFGGGKYKGQPMDVHVRLSEDKIAFQKEFFQQWIVLFDATVDELFIGLKANIVKQSARNIAQVMKYKVGLMGKNDH